MENELLYGIRIKISGNSISIIWGGDTPDLNSGMLRKQTMELSVTRIFHKVLNKGKKELREIFEKNDFEILGNMLFNILLTEQPVRNFLYDRLVLTTRNGRARCRILLEFDANALDLASLPWEYLMIQRNSDQDIAPFYWGADRNLQFDLVRYVAPQAPPKQQPSLHELTAINVILVVNSPLNNPVEDMALMVNCLEKLREKYSSFNLYSGPDLVNPSFYDLKERLTEYLKYIQGPYVLHILGHAHLDKEQSGIFFSDENGHAEEIGGAEFATLFEYQNYAGDFRLPILVVLQACESGQVGEKGNGIGFLLARNGVPAVVAMQNEISEDASLHFVKQFYLSLLKGDDVARAVTKGRAYMAIEYNKKEKRPEQHYSDNTFGSPVVFISTDAPFRLLPSDEKSKVRGIAKECKRCGYRYENTSLEFCLQQNGRCKGTLEPILETSHAISAPAIADKSGTEGLAVDEAVSQMRSAR